MTGKELTDRLIDDIKKVIQAKSIARSQDQLMIDATTYANDPNFDLNYSIEESWISLTYDISFPGDLAVLAQFINLFEPIIDFVKNRKIEIVNYLEQVEGNKKKIAEYIQKVKDNEKLVFSSGKHNEPLFNSLQERLDYIHTEAAIVNNCYYNLLKKRDS